MMRGTSGSTNVKYITQRNFTVTLVLGSLELGRFYKDTLRMSTNPENKLRLRRKKFGFNVTNVISSLDGRKVQ